MDSAWRVSDRFEKSQQIVRGDGGRAVVAEGMAIEKVGLQHALVQDDPDITIGVIDGGEWRDRARSDTENPVQFPLVGP